MMYQLIPLVAILILMFHAFSLPLYKRKKSVYRNNVIVALIQFILHSITLWQVALHGSFVFNVGHYVQPVGIAFRVGAVDALMALLFSFVYGLVIWFSVRNLSHEIDECKISSYYTLSTLLLASLLGIVYTYDIFTGFVFLEVNTLASCGLIAIKDQKENIKATLKYMILSSLSSGLVLLAIAFIYAVTGHLSMPFIAEALKTQFAGHENLVFTSLTLFTFGVAIKSALFPLHVWLPDAYTYAPTTTSAILSGIVNKAPLVFLIKIFYVVFGIEILQASKLLPVLLAMGAVAMIMGSLFARTQKELKRMVAYSSVAQVGYIFLGLGLGNLLGLVMAVYQMAAHSITKSTIFLTSGLMIEKTGMKEIEKLKGVGKHMPITLGIFSLCGLSMVGIPVLPGFINKWNLAIAALQADKIGLLVIILISSLLNATYYFPITINGFFGEAKMDTSIIDTKEKSVKEAMPMLILAVGIVLLGALSGNVIDLIEADLQLMMQGGLMP